MSVWIAELKRDFAPRGTGRLFDSAKRIEPTMTRLPQRHFLRQTRLAERLRVRATTRGAHGPA